MADHTILVMRHAVSDGMSFMQHEVTRAIAVARRGYGIAAKDNPYAVAMVVGGRIGRAW